MLAPPVGRCVLAARNVSAVIRPQCSAALVPPSCLLPAPCTCPAVVLLAGRPGRDRDGRTGSAGHGRTLAPAAVSRQTAVSPAKSRSQPLGGSVLTAITTRPTEGPLWLATLALGVLPIYTRSAGHAPV